MSVVTGCARDLSPEAVGPYPSDYKRIIADHIRQSYYDPYSLRDVRITTPKIGGNRMGISGWGVCVEANAKNRMGAYVGLTRTTYVINRGKVIYASELEENCQTHMLRAWPEMEGGDS